MGASVGVIGASGYAGGELLRLLAGHPAFEVVVAAAGRRAGDAIADVLPHLGGLDAGVFAPIEQALGAQVDVCFCCLPSGSEQADAVAAGVVVDLSDTHRFAPGWAYGLPELDRDEVRGATRIANPGCYPTAVELALAPFIRAGVVGDSAIVDAISGVSGAGRREEDRLLFTNLEGDVSAYGSVMHRHVPEMEEGLRRYGGATVTVSFTPHLAPVARGLLATCRMPASGLDDESARSILRDAYRGEPFISVVDDWPGPKAVSGSNRVHLSARVDERADWLIVSAALDNLGKGAAGQAIQNANLAGDLPETMGLEAVGVWP
ncbi:MAG: N-acetyl-gamma-glutamyl-phosphate reductase [Actinobacteria bacterium]|nr:N-acetyl-gamma-glutamyl-phosphate reductase [Actinomycetota bacterium]